ncbi:MAG TPA: cyclic nucleotide-binding domain-containing protein [Syntrophales bacterium]|jgi:CRP-like cAMP-binding protein|nr:cyclic nucleotide-binding domain-containing protein [Syntrophales bacterium]HPI57266.1 cyclic nucleotide-binding domain-containing protein [Syntrophales bacterium]HPN25146.1 cyclic nucleotide-binding domain-containing protein [Syntrophales bacterium]HQM29434.1 cyclic nucleotide-binding domain-containing protein [Syntrophales bacterium]
MVSAEILREANIFRNLNDTQIDKLASIAVSETHKAGTLLYKEGDLATHLYIVEEGKVFLQMETGMGSDRPPMRITVDTITGGQAMGWSVFVEPHKYTLSGLCMENSKLVSFEADKLRDLLNQDSVLGVEMMKGIVRVLASRLNNTRILLINEMAMAQLRSKGETLQ